MEQECIRLAYANATCLAVIFEEARLVGQESDEQRVNTLLAKLEKPEVRLDFQSQSIAELDRLRITLYAFETEFQRRFSEKWDPKTRW